MTGLILVHESGHALVMKKLGIPFSPMVFIPFVRIYIPFFYSCMYVKLIDLMIYFSSY